MSESLVFHSQTKLILETVIKCALDLMAGFANENQSTEAGFNKMVELLAQEASRKINSVFLQLSDATNKEKLTLRDKVSKLESRLTAVTEDLDGIKIWRENVMSGCPVLNEQTGWVLTLKPFGMLVKSADESTKEDGNFVTPAGGRHIKEFTLEEANCGDVSSAWKQDIAEDDKMTPSSDSQNPLPAEVSKVFECDVCKKRFSRQLHLRRHLDTHKESLSCHQCSRTFRSSAMLERHLLRHNEKTPQSFACPLCDQTFKSKKLLKSHESVHGDDVRPFACDQFLQGKAFTCETCGAGFTLRQNLKRHNRIHTGERPFKCHVCGASFIQDKLKAHMLIHGASKSFMCDLCGKTFLYNCQLKKHQKLLHQDGTEAGTQAGRRRARVRGNRTIIFKRDRTTVEVAAFTCKTCQRGFDSEGALKKHELIHAGGAPYDCDVCGKAFLYRATFDYHLRTHWNKRPYACDVCGKTFIIRHALKSHRLRHTGEKPHTCEECGKAFRVYTNYRRHLRIHTGEKPYECEVCGVRFRQLGHVKFHMQVHTGERPYSCAACGLGFSDSRQLKKHLCARNDLVTTLLTS